MTVWEFLIDLHKHCHFQTKEGKLVGRASNSELKRWCNNKAIIINGKQVKYDDVIDYDINTFVMFTKKNTITLW